MVAYREIETPYGWLAVAASEWGLTRLLLPEPSRETLAAALASEVPGARPGASELLRKAERQIGTYFAGKPVDFSLPLDLRDVRGFRARVYDFALKIPWGEVRCYTEVARGIGAPRAARAVGGALGANPVPLVIPCHRVVAAGERLGGFSATGGLALKAAMLRLEGTVLL